jgi:hypothetical protein
MGNPERERQMFGMTLDQVIAEKPKYESAGMWAMSILSDVQELIARDSSATARERARQWINKAKYWIDIQTPPRG